MDPFKDLLTGPGLKSHWRELANNKQLLKPASLLLPLAEQDANGC